MLQREVVASLSSMLPIQVNFAVWYLAWALPNKDSMADADVTPPITEPRLIAAMAISPTGGAEWKMCVRLAAELDSRFAR
jgi:hypothetical protein